MFQSPYQQNLPAQFDVAYPSHPWAGISTNQRTYFDPVLRDFWRQRTIFGDFVTYAQNLGDVNARQMVITTLFDVHPNFNPIGLRDMWMPAAHVDTQSQTITFTRYGGKVAYDAYTPIITYWKRNPQSLNVIASIVQDKLGQHMVDVMDMLARNAMLQTNFKYYPNGKSNFGQLSSADTVTTQMLNDIHLGMKYRGVPYADTGNGSVGNIVCITSPGVLYDLQQQTDPKDWLYPMAYARPGTLLNYEVGTYRNIRFVETPKCVLYNCGAIITQAEVTAPIQAGDGAPGNNALVDGTYNVGQPGATNYIQLAASTNMSNFQVGDIVTIHRQRTNAFGVTNGVDFRDGTVHNRRIVTVDTTNRRLTFDQPIMLEFTTNLGGGVYAYVTKGVHVNAMIFIGGPNGVIAGIGRPPRLHTPPPVDDFDMIYRFSWDAYMGYNQFDPRVIEVAFVNASFRYAGPVQIQG
jgi:hypothetical protein